MAILRKAAVSLGTFAAVAALLLVGGILFNGTVSAITGSGGSDGRNPDATARKQADKLLTETAEADINRKAA